MNKYKTSVEAYKAGNEFFNQLTNFENYNKIIKLYYEQYPEKNVHGI